MKEEIKLRFKTEEEFEREKEEFFTNLLYFSIYLPSTHIFIQSPILLIESFLKTFPDFLKHLKVQLTLILP